MVLSPLVYLLLLVRSVNGEHPSTFAVNTDYDHHAYGDITGYKCPADSKVNIRAPKAPYTCPAGSDPAVTIKWGYDKTGSNIYQSFGSTAIASYKKKKICGLPSKFVTGAPHDPYPKLSINQVSEAIKNKKIVRIMGHTTGLMCSRMRPRLNIHLNKGDANREVIMPTTWADEENTLGSATFSIQPPCLERDGNDGRKDDTYDGRAIDYHSPSGSKKYGTCSFAGTDLECHRSPDFDTGAPV